MIHPNESRSRGARLLLAADQSRRRAKTMRALGALAATAGALFQNGPYAALGGLLLAAGLVMLALAGEVRRRSGALSRRARQEARRALAEYSSSERFRLGSNASHPGRRAA